MSKILLLNFRDEKKQNFQNSGKKICLGRSDWAKVLFFSIISLPSFLAIKTLFVRPTMFITGSNSKWKKSG